MNNEWKNNWKGNNIGGSISTVASGATSILSNALNSAQIEDTSNITNQIQDTASAQFNYGDFDAVQNAFNPYALNPEISASDIRGMSTGAKLGSFGKGIASGAMTGSVLGPWGTIGGAIVGGAASILGIARGNNKAARKAEQLNESAKLANDTYTNNYINNINNISQGMFNRAAINVASEGGSIKSRHPKYRGFNNAFAYGGDLALSGDFSNGVTIVDEGGSHEENKFGGVLMGVDENGVPNLVEEGEVIWNDYVFSRRNRPTKSQLREVLLNPRYEGKTYAEIAKLIQKESSESPFDPISKNTLENNMGRLMMAQEQTRYNKGIGKSNKFAPGGDLNPDIVIPYRQTMPQFDNKAYAMNTGNSIQKAYNNLILDNIINHTANAPVNIDNDYNVGDIDFSGLDTSVKKARIPRQSSNVFNSAEFLRYWPAVQSGIQTISDAAGWSNKIDYSNPNLIRNANRGIRNVSTRPVGNYVGYTPIDTNYMQQQIANLGLATQRGMLNASSGNRNAAIAGLAALNNNITSQFGEAYRQAIINNANLKNSATQINAGINTHNSQLGLQADARNQAADIERANNTIREAMLRDQSESAWSQARSQNITNFGNNIGNVGRDSFNNRLSFDYLRALGLEDQYKNYVMRGRRLSRDGGPLHIKLDF